jgi:mRNA interferase RelE/StbE
MTKCKHKKVGLADNSSSEDKIYGPFNSAEEVFASLKDNKGNSPNIKYSTTFKRYFKELSPIKQEKFYRALKLLLTDPNHPSLRTSKLYETKSQFECRISKSFRLIFEKENNEYYLRYVGDHTILDRRKYK